MGLAFFLSLFTCPKDTAGCGEASSPHVLIDVLICYREFVMEIKKPWQVVRTTCQGES
jgi:hypothetical protein